MKEKYKIIAVTDGVFFILGIIAVFLKKYAGGSVFAITGLCLLGGGLYLNANREAAIKAAAENAAREANEFNEWLLQNGFVQSGRYGDFIYDGINCMWCKFGMRMVFSASDTAQASIRSVNVGNRRAAYYQYEITIRTTCLQMPIVKFERLSHTDAQSIKSIVDVFRKTGRKEEHDFV